MNNPTSTPQHDEAHTILEALRQIQDSPELQAEARHNPTRVLDRLNLSGIARSAVTLGIAGFTVAAHSGNVASPCSFWAG
jgi:hypothetical protein